MLNEVKYFRGNKGTSIGSGGTLMYRSENKGICQLCLESVDYQFFSDHFKRCISKIDSKDEKNKLLDDELIYLLVVFYGEIFWLYIEIKSRATLKQLDSLLRNTWLECCDHKSHFYIDGEYYASDGGMNIPIYRVLNEGSEFDYEYDFKNTTDLEGIVVSTRKGKMKENIRLIARNQFPEEIKCAGCQRLPEIICINCDGFYCKKCRLNHTECGNEESMMPVINSPRMGVCDYIGMKNI